MVSADHSHLSHVSESNVSLNQSQLQMVHDVDVDIVNSGVYQTKRSRISGQHLSVFGGDDHAIDADHYLGLVGHHHHIEGDRSIGIGDQLSIQHPDATLINLSKVPMRSDRPGQLKIRADGGVHVQLSDQQSLAVSLQNDGWANVSDESLKMALTQVDPIQILTKVKALPINYWAYKNQKDVQHIGPFSQDFYRLFNYGNSDKVIHSIDADGVLLAAIKGLHMSLENLEDTFQMNESLTVSSQQSLFSIEATLNDYQKQLDDLSKLYAFQQRLLNEFNQDVQTQDEMLAYVENVVSRLKLQGMVSKVYLWRYWLLGLGFLLGGLLQGLIYWRRSI